MANQATAAVVDAFFDAIAAALGVPRDALWDRPDARAFAGYAPVLAAIGSLLARETNPIRLKNALEAAGGGSAWDVIERVSAAILDREQEQKVKPQLARDLSGAMPDQIYDREEQLTYLYEHVIGRTASPSTRIVLSGPDAEIYRRTVEKYLPEHPFLQDGRLENEVLASIVLAHATVRSLLSDPGRGLDMLRDASRQPFLWRSIQNYIDNGSDVMLLGFAVGPVLNSLWNDPLAAGATVRVVDHETDSDLVTVTVERRDRHWTFNALGELEFYAEIRDADVCVSSPTRIRGYQGARGVASFDVYGSVVLLVNETLIVDAAPVRLDGDLRAAAEECLQPGNLILTESSTSRVWWGGRLAEQPPWSDHRPELDSPTDVGPTTELERFLLVCRRRIPDGAPIVIDANWWPADFNKTAWLDYDRAGLAFPIMMELFVEHGFARTEPIQAAGSHPKRRLHFTNLTWTVLIDALHSESQDPELRSLVAELLAMFGEEQAPTEQARGIAGSS